MVDSIFDKLKRLAGTVYAIPLESSSYIIGQIGQGGDLGVTDQIIDDVKNLHCISHSILFRVLFSYSAIRRGRWINLGMHPLVDALRRTVPYGHKEIGKEEYWAVTMDGSADQQISFNEFSKIERADIYESEHILQRIHRELSNRKQ